MLKSTFAAVSALALLAFAGAALQEHGLKRSPKAGDAIKYKLKAELEFHAGRQLIRKQKSETAGGKAVTILGDKQIPYRLLRKVMVSCARADYSNISFAVLRKNVLTE